MGKSSNCMGHSADMVSLWEETKHSHARWEIIVIILITSYWKYTRPPTLRPSAADIFFPAHHLGWPLFCFNCNQKNINSFTGSFRVRERSDIFGATRRPHRDNSCRRGLQNSCSWANPDGNKTHYLCVAKLTPTWLQFLRHSIKIK